MGSQPNVSGWGPGETVNGLPAERFGLGVASISVPNVYASKSEANRSSFLEVPFKNASRDTLAS